MTPRNAVILGDCIDQLAHLDADSVDAIVCDPPYGLEFMGKAWDGFDTAHAFGEWCRQWATEALRVLKPGGYCLAFGGTRTYHRLVSGLEDAGFEIRDTIAWLYGSGFPKSLDVSKALDKAAGAEREVSHVERSPWKPTGDGVSYMAAVTGDTRPVGKDGYQLKVRTAPFTDAARTWSGFGTALKPAHEPIVVARKPLVGTVATNVERHGTGALNIDGCRVEGVPPSVPQPSFDSPTGNVYGFQTGEGRNGEMSHATGRWPANVAHDGSVDVLELFPQERDASAARFFYCAKASRADREAGLDGLDTTGARDYGAGKGVKTRQCRVCGDRTQGDAPPYEPACGHGDWDWQDALPIARANDHPTVKPHDLMRWLVRLVGGQRGSLILDPFAGSGSTLRAAKAEGFDFLGIERDPHYYRLACLRAGLPDPGEVAA